MGTATAAAGAAALHPTPPGSGNLSLLSRCPHVRNAEIHLQVCQLLYSPTRQMELLRAMLKKRRHNTDVDRGIGAAQPLVPFSPFVPFTRLLGLSEQDTRGALFLRGHPEGCVRADRGVTLPVPLHRCLRHHACLGNPTGPQTKTNTFCAPQEDAQRVVGEPAAARPCRADRCVLGA